MKQIIRRVIDRKGKTIALNQVAENNEDEKIASGNKTRTPLGIDMAPHMPTDPNNAKNTFLYNYEWWADYRDDIDAKFQAWLTQ